MHRDSFGTVWYTADGTPVDPDEEFGPTGSGTPMRRMMGTPRHQAGIDSSRRKASEHAGSEYLVVVREAFP